MAAQNQRDREFCEFVQTRRSRLVGAAYLLCGDRHAAEDLVQTALAKLYVAWPRLARRGSEDAYVRRILANAAIDAHRRPWRRERATAELPDRAAPEGFGLEERDELTAAVNALPPRQRRVVVLRYWLGLSIEETAADLHISTSTVKSQSAKALASIRAVLLDDRTVEILKGGDR